MSNIIFKAENVTKQYRKFHLTSMKFKTSRALSGLDMAVHRGDVYGLVGKNGAGKTTLIRIMAGIAAQTSGKITLFGESDARTMYRQRSRINGIIETPAFYPGLTARDNLEISRLQRGIQDRGRVDKALKVTGLSEVDSQGLKARNFSLGMKQRLGIAMALMGNPEFLFFDEPLNGLDPVGIQDFRGLIQELNEKYGITILISSHMLRELDELATCYGFVHNGKMLEQISSEALKEKFEKYLALRVDDVTKAENILKNILNISRLEVVSRNTIHLREQLERDQEIMRELVTRGVAVKEMAVMEENLERYYLSLIKSQLSDGMS